MTNDRKTDKKEVKKPRPKAAPVLTPEFIAEQRAKREQRKADKRKLREEQGLADPQQVENDFSEEKLGFIKRPLLRAPGVEAKNPSSALRIMTYNVLAQTLIRRELFPENGEILKWKLRSKVLTEEIRYYKPNIVCMQEVDKDRAVDRDAGKPCFWKDFFSNSGLAYEFYTLESKTHGQLIAYDPSIFELIKTITVSYDDVETPGAPKQIISKNTAIFLILRYRNSQEPESGLIVGTTHLFWHPKGSYERTRQMAIFLTKANELSSMFQGYKVALAGDFNSECFDGPYMYATGADVGESTDTYRIMVESALHKFTKSIDENAVDITDEDNSLADSTMMEKTNIEHAEEKVNALAKMFSLVPNKFVSIYGKYYKYVHDTNIHPRSNGEPSFSNWAHSWRGLLDYIFVLESQQNDIATLELLRLPEPDEMGDEPSGQPRIGQYPSDHLCLMATLEPLNR